MDSDLMRWVKAQADDPNANPRFRELLAALEAAREDAARYRRLRAMATQQADSLGPIFRIDVRRSAPYLFNFDAAIDQARGKAGGEVGP